jgi:preprotein translocase subunit SecF
MLSYILSNCSMSKQIIIFMVLAIIGFAVNENIVVTAQTNSTNLDKRNIVVTWLETNDTKTIDTPVISVSNEDFWKMFEPLLKQSFN